MQHVRSLFNSFSHLIPNRVVNLNRNASASGSVTFSMQKEAEKSTERDSDLIIKYVDITVHVNNIDFRHRAPKRRGIGAVLASPEVEVRR